jgi:hypothetical protein
LAFLKRKSERKDRDPEMSAEGMQNLPNAQLIVYPDSNHGSFYQYPELFVAQATQFLDTQFKAPDGASESLPFPSLPSSN